MVIKKEDVKELFEQPSGDIEKTTTLSYDGKNLLTRIPKEIVKFLKLKDGYKLRWIVKSKTKEIVLEVVNVIQSEKKIQSER